MTVEEVLTWLESEGWVTVRREGRFRKLEHPDRPGAITVAGDAADDLNPGSMRSIIREVNRTVR